MSGVVGYRQILEADLASALPTAMIGDVAYAWDTDRHYRFLSTGVWTLIPNQADIMGWITNAIPKTFVNGVQKTTQRLKWIDSVAVGGGSGLATFYLTSDRTSTGTARATAIDLDSIMLRTEDGTSQYAFGSITSPNVKTIIATIFKQAFAGAVVLSINLLGSVSNVVAPNGTVVKLVADGDAA